MTESPALEAARGTDVDASPFTGVATPWRIVVQFVAALLMTSVGFYTMFIYAASYLTERMHVSTARALDINTASLLVMLPFAALGAILSSLISFLTALGLPETAGGRDRTAAP